MHPEDVPQKLILRVLEEYDPNFKVHVARCLETGTLATADSMDEAHDLLMETLRPPSVRFGHPVNRLARGTHN